MSNLFFNVQHPTGVIILPSGVDHSMREYINIFREVYGDKQGKQFRIWVDNISATQISPDTWVVKFDKWELDGMRILFFLLFMLISFPSPLDLSNQSIGYFILLHIMPLLTEFANFQVKSAMVVWSLPY